MTQKHKKSVFYRKSYLWVTLIFFLFSLALHWLFGWYAFKQEQLAHSQPVVVNDYIIEMARDTMENWQSEFLQLIWQVAGLAFLLYAGSPQSKEGDERMEKKLDYILKKIAPDEFEDLNKELEEKYPKK